MLYTPTHFLAHDAAAGAGRGRRPAARTGAPCIVFVDSVITLIGPDVHSRANGHALSQRAAADQGDAYGEMALRALRRRSQLIP